MMTWKLAWRNLLRSPRRVILTLVAIVVGIGVFVLGESFIGGFEENVRVSTIEGLTGHVLVRPHDYPSQGMQYPVDQMLTLDDELQAFLDERTRFWTERILFAPTAATGEDHLRVRAIGYDPERDPKVFSRSLWLLEGSEPAPDTLEVMLTPGIARLLNLDVGDFLVLQTRTHQGAMNALEVKVSAIVTTRLSNIDTISIFLPLSLARQMIASQEATHIGIRLASREDSKLLKEKLEGILGDQAEVVTWQEESAELMGLMALRRRVIQVLSLILLALAGFGMANTILMAAHERVREVGTLRSMGMTTGGVTGLFMVEGLVMGLVGSLLGAMIGGGLAWHWERNPIDATALMDEVAGENMAFSALLYTDFNLTVILAGIAFGTVIAVFSSIYPARVAATLPPAEAVRAEQ